MIKAEIRATLIAGMMERRNDRITERRKISDILKDGVAEKSNELKSPEMVKYGFMERQKS